MKDLVTIGLPSKGRLKEKSISFFNDRGLKIIQSEKERNYSKIRRRNTRYRCIWSRSFERVRLKLTK